MVYIQPLINCAKENYAQLLATHQILEQTYKK